MLDMAREGWKGIQQQRRKEKPQAPPYPPQTELPSAAPISLFHQSDLTGGNIVFESFLLVSV
jgi:hypothetical protein